MPAEPHRCARLARQLVAGGPEALQGDALDELSRAHLRRCARCAQVARQVQDLHAGLAALRDEPLPVPAHVPGAVAAAVLTAERSVGRRFGWVAGGLAAAATAGAAGALVLQGHARRARLAG